MSRRFNNEARQQRPSPRPFDDTMQVWRAREAYRVQTWLEALIIIPLGLLPLSHLLQGHWGSALGIVVAEVVTICGLRRVWRLGRQWARGWWQGLALLVVLSVSLSGCQDVVRAVANLHGYNPSLPVGGS